MAKKVFVEQTKLFVTFEDLTTMHSKDSILVSADVFFEVYPSIQKSPIVPVEEKAKIKEIYSAKAKHPHFFLKHAHKVPQTSKLDLVQSVSYVKYCRQTFL